MIPINVLIDDKTVIDDLESCSIKMDGGFCNSLDLSLKSQKFWAECDPTTDFGELKLKVVIGATTYEFLCEERSSSVSKDGLGFTVWGRSKQALLSNPYSKTISDTEDTTHPWQIGVTTAETIISYVVSNYCPYSVTVDWNITDFSIYEDSFSVSNQSPIEVISALANIVGAELKAHNDGSLSVETYSVAEEATVATYTDLDDIVGLNENIEYSSGFNAVTIHGYDPAEASSISAHISIKSITDSLIVPDDTQTVRVYYYHSEGLTPICYGSVCSATKSGIEQITEDVQLIWGHGNTSKPDTNGETEITGNEDTPIEIKSVTYGVNYQEYCLRPSSAEGDYYFFFYFSDQSAYSIHTLTVAESDEDDEDDPDTPDDPDKWGKCGSIVLEKEKPDTVVLGCTVTIHLYRSDLSKYLGNWPVYMYNSAGTSIDFQSSEIQKRVAEEVTFTNGEAALTYPSFAGVYSGGLGDWNYPYVTFAANIPDAAQVRSNDGSNKLKVNYFVDKPEYHSIPATVQYFTKYNKYTTFIPRSFPSTSFKVWFTFADCDQVEIDLTIGDGDDVGSKDITINVKDYVAETNIESASVYIDGSYKGKTDEDGLLSVNDVSVGDHTIKITASNYLTSDLDDLANDEFTVS